MKTLYDFKVSKEDEVEETTTSKNDKGEEVVTATKIKKPVDHDFGMKRPTRKMYDEAELFYGVKLSEGIKAGLLTRALLAKRFNNDGGVLSDVERERFSDLYMGLFEKQAELQRLSVKTEAERNSDEQERYKDLIMELTESREEIQEFEMAQASLFDQTAENRARNKTILWWVLQLAYEKKHILDEDKYVPFFGDGEYEQRLDKYDEIDESDDDYLLEVLRKFSYYVSFWYITKPNNKEDFEQLIAASENPEYGGSASTEETPEEETPEEETPEEETPEEEAPVEEPRVKDKHRKKKRHGKETPEKLDSPQLEEKTEKKEEPAEKTGEAH